MGSFKDRLAARRSRQGLDQHSLAQRAGVSAGSISAWERGVNEPTVQKLRDLAEALGCSVGWLIGEDAPESNVVPAVQDQTNRPSVPAWVRSKIIEIRALADATTRSLRELETDLGISDSPLNYVKNQSVTEAGLAESIGPVMDVLLANRRLSPDPPSPGTAKAPTSGGKSPPPARDPSHPTSSTSVSGHRPRKPGGS